ncbi:Centromere protein H [Camelus dromedarius]|uniref:Centromere protein H n=1 Tax=Camelus dromedarius TaxID=9838 RepID=A0A5N4ED31_CAMDR|nr:Centromere protein H [Camelus dromedarius]
MEKQSEEQAAAEPADSGGEGGPPQVAGAQAARPEDRMTLLLRLRAQTKQQLLEYNSMVDARNGDMVSNKTDFALIELKFHVAKWIDGFFKKMALELKFRCKIEELEKEIEEVKIAFEMKKLALDRMQLSTALKKNLEKMDIKTSVLMDNMTQILNLNKLIMKLQQETWDLEEKLLDVRKKRLQLKQASESKLLEIQTEKNKQKGDLDSMENSDKIKNIQQNLQKEIQITTVIQHVFQNLILGSKVNWAEDSALKEMVLQLEKNLTMIQ